MWSLVALNPTARPPPTGTAPAVVRLEAGALSEPVSIGFSFPFGAGRYDTLHIGAGGLVVFGGMDRSLPPICCAGDLYSAASTSLIAPFWVQWKHPETAITEIEIEHTLSAVSFEFALTQAIDHPGAVITTKLTLRSNGQFEIQLLDGLEEFIETVEHYSIGWQLTTSQPADPATTQAEQVCVGPGSFASVSAVGGESAVSCAASGTVYTFVPAVPYRDTDPCSQQAHRIGLAGSLLEPTVLSYEADIDNPSPICYWNFYCPHMSVIKLDVRWLNASVDGDFLRVTDPLSVVSSGLDQGQAARGVVGAATEIAGVDVGNFSSTTNGNVLNLKWSSLSSPFSFF